jgi:hypothetical protein
MDSEIEEIYKKNQFIHAIKNNGKVPNRSGLGGRLYLLAGYTQHRVYCTMESCNTPITGHLLDNTFTKRLSYSRYIYNLEKGTIDDHIHSKQMRDTFQKYLKEYVIVNHWNYIFVYFDPKNSPSWALMDNDLKSMYPYNYRVDKKGFVFYK